MTIGKKNHKLYIIFSLFCIWSLWAIISLSGCNPIEKNIPQANTYVSGAATLMWNEIPGAISYNIYVSKSPGITKLYNFKIRNVTNPFKVEQLEVGKTYYFVVTVVNESGESEESKELSYTAVANEIGLIYFKNLFDKSVQDQKSSTSAEQGNVTLSWDKVPSATSYNIYWNDSPGVTKHNGKKISYVNSPYTIKGLKRGVTYYFVITAVNAFKEIDESEELSFTAK
jgi:YHS domain-containing protein